MASKRAQQLPTLPRGWTKQVKTAFLHAVSLAASAMTVARARAASSRRPTLRLQADLDQAQGEIALLREELDLKDGRWSRLPFRRRPHFAPIQRMRVLQLKAARGWSCAQAAARFCLDEQTLQAWMRRIDEQANRPLVQTQVPVNRFPDFVRHLVGQLKVLVPTMGKVRIAQTLARAGIHLGATTVGRILKEPRTPPPEEDHDHKGDSLTVVIANCPGHVWSVDLTTVPTSAGFWVPWSPHSLNQRWPFCWWLAVVVDHFSRVLVGFAVFKKQPTAVEIRNFVRRAAVKSKTLPKHIVTDQGRQFTSKMFRRWCRRRGIQQRFGALGQYGSIAVVERFMRTLKSEGTRRVLTPLQMQSMRREIDLFAVWYNGYRPHQSLDGRTPTEVHRTVDSPPDTPRSNTGDRVTLAVSYLEGRRHLPVVQLRPAA